MAIDWPAKMVPYKILPYQTRVYESADAALRGLGNAMQSMGLREAERASLFEKGKKPKPKKEVPEKPTRAIDL